MAACKKERKRGGGKKRKYTRKDWNPVGVASALRVHMGYIAGLVPGTKAASTCQVNAQGARSPHPRCGSGPIISITSEEDRRLSLGLRRKEYSEPRVNFSLPPSK